jgi:hypothetical protein
MRVQCDVELVDLTNDTGHTIESIRVVCLRCEARAESFGRGDASVRRCMAMLRDQCDEYNYYIVDDND